MHYDPHIQSWERAMMGQCEFRLPQNITQGEKEYIAKNITKYILFVFMGWSAEEAVQHMNRTLANILMLDKVFCGIKFPIDCYKDDWGYKIAYAIDYPVNYKRQTLRYYQMILNGNIAKFPKGFFAGTKGQQKAALLLQKFIAERLPAHLTTTDENEKYKSLYARFADRAAMNNLLKDAQIFDVCARLYSSPLQYLHSALTLSGEHNSSILDTLYAYHEFSTIYDDTSRVVAQEKLMRRRAEKRARAASAKNKKN